MQMRKARSYRIQRPEGIWEDRLMVYLRLGPGRTLEKAWRTCCNVPDTVPDAKMPSTWRTAMRRRGWHTHAEAYDRTGSILSVYDISTQGISNWQRATRLEKACQILLQDALIALGNAQLGSLSQIDVLKHLSSTRLLFSALIKLLRESTALNAEEEQTDNEDTFSAAVWSAALESARAHLRAHADAMNPPVPPTSKSSHSTAKEKSPSEVADNPPSPPDPGDAALPHPPNALLIVVGNDPALKVDLAMLRAVRQESGLRFHRIEDATRRKVINYLRREREHGRPVRWLHLACHGSEEGVLLADGLVNGDWLSTHLQGIEVLVIAACNGDEIGDWLAVIPHVITFSDAIDNGDAAAFTRHFWTELVRTHSPERALASALTRSQPHVEEFIVKHW